MMTPRGKAFRFGLVVAAIVIASNSVCNGFGIQSTTPVMMGSTIRNTPLMMSSSSSNSGDNFGSRPLPSSNQLRTGSSSPSSTSTTQTEAVSIGISTDAYTTKGPGLRSRLYQGIKKRIKNKSRNKVEEITNVYELKSLISDESEASSSSSYVAVMFHAPYCKACQAAIPLYQRMARKYASKGIKFVSVPLMESNKDQLKQELGVSKFPFGHIYSSGNKDQPIEELPLLRKHVPHFEETVKSLLKDE